MFRDEKTIGASELRDFHIIGVELENGFRGKIIKVKRYNYVLDTIVSDNSYDALVSGGGIQELIRKLDYCINDIVVFERPESLIKWLSEEPIEDIRHEDFIR